MDSDGPTGGGGRTPAEVIDIMSTIASRLGEGARGTESGSGHDAGFGQASASAQRVDEPEAPAGLPASYRAAPPASLSDPTSFEAPLRSLTDGFAMWGRAIHEAVGGHVQQLARHVDMLERRVAGAEATANAARAGVRDVPQRVQGVETSVADAVREAREARTHLQEILRLLTEQGAHADRLDAAFAEHTDRLVRLDAGLAARAGDIAALRAANTALATRLARRTRLAALACVTLAAALVWLAWPKLAALVTLVGGH